mmetsp:Transcript_32897/g.101097  ORF Transcript_32897/g.101097 Transcript_32897/m.101097 type:complete len:261 (-) Transcript_32897:107-889(-)
MAGGAEPAVLLERPSLLALWKPAGWSVTVGHAAQAPGRRSRGRPLEEWLSQHLAGRYPIMRDPGAQHGLLHRLDLETSGVLCCAATYRGYHLGMLQFVARRVRKAYLCLCHGHVPCMHQLLEVPLRTTADGPGGALRSCPSQRGRPARTELRSVAHLVCTDGAKLSFVEVRLHTGRTHQIRAHLAHEGHPLVGDNAYGVQADAAVLPRCPRLFLHAHHLVLDVGDGPIDVRSPLPADLREVMRSLAATSRESATLLGLAW